MAFRLPNFFRRLFAEGAFSAAFVPMFAGDLQGEGRDAALAFARQAHVCLLVILVPFSLVMMVALFYSFVYRPDSQKLADLQTQILAKRHDLLSNRQRREHWSAWAPTRSQ